VDDLSQWQIEQYRAIRSEVLDALKGQQWSLTAGNGVVAIVAPVLALASDGRGLDLVWLIWLFVLPALESATMRLWSVEVRRMVRAGKFLNILERRLDGRLDSPEEWRNWEALAHDEQFLAGVDTDTLLYHVVIPVHGLLATLWVGVGTFLAWRTSHGALWVLILSACMLSIVLIYTYKLWSHVRSMVGDRHRIPWAMVQPPG
jgi:hypothetical protein